MTDHSVEVILQIPIQTKGGSAWVFRRSGVMLPCLFPGMGLSGWGLPKLMGPTNDLCTQVAEIAVNDKGEIYVTAYGSEEQAYTKEQVLARLGEGWTMVPLGLSVD